MNDQILLRAVEVFPWAIATSWAAYLLYKCFTHGVDQDTRLRINQQEHRIAELTNEKNQVNNRLRASETEQIRLLDEKKALENQLKNYQTPSSFALPKPVQPTFGHQN